MPSEPAVSVILPVLDEIAEIDACLASLTAQDHGGPLEIMVADGGSTDGTLARLEAWALRDERVRVIDNPRRRQSNGLNLAGVAAAGEVLVRADAHTTYAPDYVRRSLEALARSGAVAAGGRLHPEGRTRSGRAIAAAMRSPLGIGPARFHHAETPELVDTVYLGAFRRVDFLAHGGFRTLPSGVAEDADFYWRWRRAGRTVAFDPAIRSTYTPRETLRAFVRQNWRYGVGKAEMLWLNGRLPSWRPLAPLGLVTGLLGAALLATSGRRPAQRAPLVALLAAWCGVVAAASARAATQESGVGPRTAAAVAAMHLAYGAGLTYGLLRGPAALGALRTTAPAPLGPGTVAAGPAPLAPDTAAAATHADATADAPPVPVHPPIRSPR